LPKPITILCQRLATNGIALFCIDHRWRQMAFLVFVEMGKAPLSRALREIKQLLCTAKSLNQLFYNIAGGIVHQIRREKQATKSEVIVQ